MKSMKIFLLVSLLTLSALAFPQKTTEDPGPKTFVRRVDAVGVSNWHGELTVTLNTSRGYSEIYVKRGSTATPTNYDWKLVGNQMSKVLRLTNRSTPALQTGTYNITTVMSPRMTHTLTKVARSIASEFTGKGAVPFTGGTSFRVWAPNVNSANVAGQFNNWSPTQAAMVAEPGGWWSLDLRGANAGQEYKFVFKKGTNTFWKNDPYGRQIVNSIGNNVILNHGAFNWTNGAFSTPSWNEMVIYEMHIGTFNDSPGGGPGTFQSAIARLDSLQDLGVNAIHVMPVQEFPGDFSWGYNGSHQFAVETAYGGPTNFKAFVNAANQRGIAVFLDVVHNHYGPNDLDLWRYDSWSTNNGGGIYFYNDSRANTPWGDTRPDYGRPEVRQFIRDNQMEWANEYRVSGFRWDSTVNMRRTNLGDNPDGWGLLQTLNNDLDATQPWKLNIAEDLQSDSWITRPTSQGGAGFDTQWSNYVHTMRSQITPSTDSSRNMFTVRDLITENFNGNPFQRVIYTESHDENANGKQRVTSTIDSANPAGYFAQKRSTLGAAVTLTAPGIPMLFQGQEILEDGWFTDTDPVDWSKATTHAGIRQLYKDLITLRRNRNGTSAGLTAANVNVHHINDGAKVIAFHRWKNGGANDDVIVIANFKNQTWSGYRVGLPRTGSWRVLFNSDWNGYSSLFGNTAMSNFNADSIAYDGMGFSGTVNLGPYSVVILGKS